MCGRITQKSPPNQLGLKIVDLIEPGHDVEEPAPRFNGAPGQLHWVIRRHPETGQDRLDRLLWGLIPHWVQDQDGGRKPINAKAETLWRLPSFCAAYAKRRCIVPVDNFFEWRKIKGPGPKRPYAVAMKDGSPFEPAAIWENWQRPETEEWVRTFAIITTKANELVTAIHDRMPVILHPDNYDRWLSHVEPDPRDLLAPYPAEPMTMWPISTRVNSPANDNPDVLIPLSASRVETVGVTPSPGEPDCPARRIGREIRFASTRIAWAQQKRSRWSWANWSDSNGGGRDGPKASGRSGCCWRSSPRRRPGGCKQTYSRVVLAGTPSSSFARGAPGRIA